MKPEIALRLLGLVMDWDDSTAQEEFAWLQLMARLKYDDYRDFLAGMRFLESLVAWLQQFQPEDRAAAYAFVRKRLVFISFAERERLIELLYPMIVWPRVAEATAKKTQVQPWEVLSNQVSNTHLKRELRSTLFLALSDGARLDAFRHANPGRISNEQVVVTVDPSKEKWIDLKKSLRKDLNDESAKFSRIILVDDFTGSGTSLIRKEGNEWKGKLPKFLKSLEDCEESVSIGAELVVHHLIGTPQADEHLIDFCKTFKEQDPDAWKIVSSFSITYGHKYDDSFKLCEKSDGEFFALARKYYDKRIQNKHTDKGGVEHIGLGYAGCALPLVLDHNTPNNSVALLWAESASKEESIHFMRPLFRRRQRHS